MAKRFDALNEQWLEAQRECNRLYLARAKADQEWKDACASYRRISRERLDAFEDELEAYIG